MKRKNRLYSVTVFAAILLKSIAADFSELVVSEPANDDRWISVFKLDFTTREAVLTSYSSDQVQSVWKGRVTQEDSTSLLSLAEAELFCVEATVAGRRRNEPHPWIELSTPSRKTRVTFTSSKELVTVSERLAQMVEVLRKYQWEKAKRKGGQQNPTR
jgi:hypothetical protein